MKQLDFSEIQVQARPLPFWSWNESLTPEETAAQVKAMHEAGIGGFFMHARGGLQTAYLSEAWFENVEAALITAEQLGMRAWAYDEHGWPSGFGNGRVNGLGVAYQQKYLRITRGEVDDSVLIGHAGGHTLYYDINPYYVDTLDRKVVAEFIACSYQPYYERFGRRIEGFFTDEPQISRDGIPWSFVFEEEYRARYGADLLAALPQLFYPEGDYQTTRVRFWKMVTDLFSEAFMKQVHDWCSQRGYKLTGHLVLEDTLLSQLTTNGACMPHFEYFHIPGVDWLTRVIQPCPGMLQVSSAAQQLGKEAVLTESYALCGHNISFSEMKGLYDWQVVQGINLLCQHLEGYSIRGLRKRDYPPALFTQQPWWGEYHRFNDAVSRESALLRSGRQEVDVLLLHPQTTAWALFDNGENAGIAALEQRLDSVMAMLNGKHIAFHFGDETLMERHARVEQGALVIGQQRYHTVIDTCCETLLDSTRRLLEAFRAGGGKMARAEDLPDNPVISDREILYTRRSHDGFAAHFFVNASNQPREAQVAVRGKALDCLTGSLRPFGGRHRFGPWGSLLLIEDGSAGPAAEDPAPDVVSLDGLFVPDKDTMNSLTLDRCDYWFDDVLQEKAGYVLNIGERAIRLRRPVHIRQEYHVRMEQVPKHLFLVCETPERFQIRVNGARVLDAPAGCFLDKSFKTLDIQRHLREGMNTIALESDYSQPASFYENLDKAMAFESEKNKLLYDCEIEALYLLGDFRVNTPGAWEALPRDASRYQGSFSLVAPGERVTLKHLEQQGFPFFCGSLSLRGEVDVFGDNPVLVFDRKGWNVVTVEIGSREATLLLDEPLPLKPLVGKQRGTLPIRLTLTNNLRNLLGPHHLKEGESYAVGPSSFYQEPCVWQSHPERIWHDGYCLTALSL